MAIGRGTGADKIYQTDLSRFSDADSARSARRGRKRAAAMGLPANPLTAELQLVCRNAVMLATSLVAYASQAASLAGPGIWFKVSMFIALQIQT